MSKSGKDSLEPKEVESAAETSFAHPSEYETAKLFDFYQIAWAYEPRTFPIEWDPKGNVLQSFTPDFFLPELELYIELTTLNQKLVTKKNRKVKRLRELYPDINVKIFYQKDLRHMVFKYGGKETITDHLSTTGSIEIQEAVTDVSDSEG